jgi:hypothetical protein
MRVNKQAVSEMELLFSMPTQRWASTPDELACTIQQQGVQFKLLLVCVLQPLHWSWWILVEGSCG